MGRLFSRRWLRRVVLLVTVAGAAAGLRAWRLAENAKRYGLPG